jgi:hypothetical protein
MRGTAFGSGLVLVLVLGLSGIGTATSEEAASEAIHAPMPVPVMPVPGEDRPVGPAPMAPAGPILPAPFAPSPAPADGFEGLGDNICTSALGCTIPPDTHGAVGFDSLGQVRLMEVLNTEVHIQDDTGGVVWGPVTIDDFWGVAVNPDLDGAFDPRVHHDPRDPANPLDGRWISVVCDDARTTTSAVLVGASQGADPDGAWYKTRIDADPANLVWADYPTVGFNSKWVVVQVNLFTMGGSFDSTQIWVFDKAQLYTGILTPVGDFRVSGHGGTQVPAETYDAAEGDVYLLQRWNGNSSGVGYLRLYRITGAVDAPILDWLDPVRQWVTSPEPWETSAPGRVDFAPQDQDPAPSNCANCLTPPCRIQTNDDRIQNVVLRNGTLWAAQNVFLPAGGATRSSVQWWQIATDTTVIQRGRVDDASGFRFFAFPSIAVNKHDDVLLGYSSFEDIYYASASYSFRYSFDAPDQMRDELVIRSGDACYFKDLNGIPSRNRWGDYSATVVAPDDTRLWTLQEYAASPDLLEGDARFRDKWGTYWGMLDPSRRITITDVSANEGDVGPTPFTFTLELKDATGAEYAPSPLPVTVEWKTANGTALAPTDYVAVVGGLVTFPAALPAPYPNSSVQQTVTVDVNGDSTFEGDETFFLDLTNPTNAVLDRNQATAIILNDDPQISISDVQRIEGNGGEGDTLFVFTVSLSNASPTLIQVDWATFDGSAVAGLMAGGGDYFSASGIVDFLPGIVSQPISIQVHGDGVPELDEEFFVDLTGAFGGSILKSRGVGRIIDDDAVEPGVEALTIVADSTGSGPTDGRLRLQWLTPAGAAGANQYLIKYDRSATAGGTCASPNPANPGVGSMGTISFSPVTVGTTTYPLGGLDLDYEYCFTVWIEYPGPTYSLPGVTLSARPFDATREVKWKVFSGMTLLAQPTVGLDAVATPGDDQHVHAMARGAAGGTWPAPWVPRDLGAISQKFNPIVPLAGGSRMFVSTQDGRIHAIDTADGSLIWSTQLPEGDVRGAPAGIFTAFGGAYDYVLVGTSAGAGDRLYALDPFTGAVIDAFPQLTIDGFTGMGAVNSMPSVDYANRRVYFASWRGAALGTVWCLELGPASDALKLDWQYNGAFDVNGSAVLHNGRVLVGDSNGSVISLSATGPPAFSLPLGDGEPKGFLFPDRRSNDFYVATNGKVWAVTDTGSGLNTSKWPTQPSLVAPSIVLHHPGTDDIYVGVRDYGGNASIVKIDAATGAVAGAATLETASVTIGPPALDLGYGMLHVGSVAGILYAVELGF